MVLKGFYLPVLVWQKNGIPRQGSLIKTNSISDTDRQPMSTDQLFLCKYSV